MDEKKPAKVLEFLLTQRAIRVSDPSSPYYGCYTLSREEAVLLSMPLFELILARLNEGSPEARELAEAILINLGLPRSSGV